MNTKILIDVTKLVPQERHPAIFNAFDEIEPGDSVIIHNDHDPKPVYYQLLGLKGNCFSWSYLQQGPDVWEVEITKNLPGENEETIGQMVRKDIRKAEVFKKMGIDFCCGGKKSIADACKETGVDEQAVKAELEKLDEVKTNAFNYDNWTLTFLADYIVNQHHSYVKDNTPLLRELTLKVATKHSDKHPELVQIYQKTHALLNELETHLKKEEVILFPYIKQLEANNEGHMAFDSVQAPISVMEQDHDLAGTLIHEIRALSDNYNPPANACNSYRLMLFKLEEFENDLMQHIHLENNILFPKAIQLEK